MNTHMNQPNPWLSYAIPAVIIVLVMAFRLRGVNKTRPLKLERLWILPAIYLVLAAIMFATLPPDGMGWPLSALALVLGAGLGWQRGRLMHIEVDPQTHALSARQSPAALLFIVGLLVVRLGMRAAAQGGAGTSFHLTTATITDLLVAMALGFLTFQRVEMYLRAKRLLAAARG
jgi:hypothetical protein